MPVIPPWNPGSPIAWSPRRTPFEGSDRPPRCPSHRQQVALIETAEAISGIGTEASVVLAAPGLYEVWVTGTHGRFTVGAQARATAIALATIAAGRN